MMKYNQYLIDNTLKSVIFRNHSFENTYITCRYI